MGTSDILRVFSEAGIPLVFISFLIWQIKYLISELKTWREANETMQQQFISTLENHLSTVTEAMNKQQYALEKLAQRIEITCRVASVFQDTPKTDD